MGGSTLSVIDAIAFGVRAMRCAPLEASRFLDVGPVR